MRSQKISNRAPRPFKTYKDKGGWSGGNRNDAHQAQAKPHLLPKKSACAAPPPVAPDPLPPESLDESKVC